MPVLLTVLSVAMLWVLLAVLVVGLTLILKTLQSIQGHLQKIAMGVRAIEQETRPLGARAGALAGSLQEAGSGVTELVERIAAVDRDLDPDGGALRSPPSG